MVVLKSCSTYFEAIQLSFENSKNSLILVLKTSPPFLLPVPHLSTCQQHHRCWMGAGPLQGQCVPWSWGWANQALDRARSAGQWRSHQPCKCSKKVKMWHLGTRWHVYSGKQNGGDPSVQAESNSSEAEGNCCFMLNKTMVKPLC